MNRSIAIGGGLFGLLVTIAVILLVTKTYTIPAAEQGLSARDQALNTQKQQEMAVIRQQLHLYRQTESAYPALLDELVPEYLSKLPRDPTSGEQYRYESGPDSYTLCYQREPAGSGEECYDRL